MIFDQAASTNYVRNRYLSKAHEEAVRRRHLSINENLWRAPPPGTPQLHTDPKIRASWNAKLAEVRTEQFLRLRESGVFSGPLNSYVPFDDVKLLARSTLPPDVCRAVQALRFTSSPFLVRFTEACYVKDALKHGRFRISPAGGYKDPSLNAAQQDNELQHASIRGDRRIDARIIGYYPGEDPSTARPMKVEWKELFQYMMSSNFYTLCLTDQFDARMFRDFDKDAAIIIHNPRQFLQMLEAVINKTDPGLKFKVGPVQYYDPYMVDSTGLEPGYSKNFSFSYQSEYRPTWWPTDANKTLSPFFIELGNLEAIAKPVYLSP